MKSWIILIVLAVVITTIGTVALPFLSADTSSVPEFAAPGKAAGPAPIVEVEGPLTYQFGTMTQKAFGKHPFVVKNAGPGVLELKGSLTSCSCTTSELFEEIDGKKVGKSITIQPGESHEVFVNWQTKTFAYGKYRQYIKIATNDPNKPELELAVEGKISRSVSTLPVDPSLSFMNASNEEPSLRRVAVYSEERPELKLTRIVNSNPDLIGVEIRPLTTEECAISNVVKGYAVEVTLKPSLKLGEINEKVVVETDHPSAKELEIPIKGRITGPIISMPEKITVRNATTKEGGTEMLTLLARGRKSVNFTVMKKPDNLDVSIAPITETTPGNGSRYRMIVKLQPGVEPGLLEDEIILKTDDPKVTELRLPVNVLVLGAR